LYMSDNSKILVRNAREQDISAELLKRPLANVVLVRQRWIYV